MLSFSRSTLVSSFYFSVSSSESIFYSLCIIWKFSLVPSSWL